MNLIRYVVDYITDFFRFITPPSPKYMTEERKQGIADEVLNRHYKHRALEHRCDIEDR